MKLRIVTVGKTRTKAWQLAEQDFLARIRRYAEVMESSVREADQRSLKNDLLVIQQEGEKHLKKIDPADFVVALDPRGKRFSSEQFSAFLQQKNDGGQRRIAFVIGVPLGLAAKVLERADLSLSLSPMTLPHKLVSEGRAPRTDISCVLDHAR